MLVDVVTRALGAAAVYLVLGLLFAPPFLWTGVRRIDPVAADGTRGFRILIFPGVVALWPLLLKRWIAGGPEPPEERSAHRQLAARLRKKGTQ